MQNWIRDAGKRPDPLAKPGKRKDIMFRINTEDRPLYGKIAKLTGPIILQNLLSAAVTSADVIMLNFVGQEHISAVSLAAAPADSKGITAQGTNFPGMLITVSEAEGEKCPRCWMHSVHANAEGLCPRCARVVSQLTIDR